MLFGELVLLLIITLPALYIMWDMSWEAYHEWRRQNSGRD